MLNSTAARTAETKAHAWFMKHLPELTSRARAFLHRLPKHEAEEAMAELLAQSLQYAISAERRGKLDRLTPYSLVTFFGRGYFAGRRLNGMRTTDVLSEAGRKRHGRRIVSLRDRNGGEVKDAPRHLPLSDVLADPKADRPHENVRRNLDYPQIVGRPDVNPQVQRVFTFLCETAAQGKQADLALELGVSEPRVCQLKGQLAGLLDARGYRPSGRLKEHARRGRPSKPQGEPKRGIPLNVGTSPAPAA